MLMESPSAIQPSAIRRLHGHVHVVAIPVDQEKGGLVGGPPHGSTEVVNRFHGLTVHLLDDIARTDAGIGRAAIWIDILNNETLLVRCDRDAERGLVRSTFLAFAASAASR